MRRYIFALPVIFIVFFALTGISWKPSDIKSNPTAIAVAEPTADQLFASYVQNIYQTANLEASGLSMSVFEKAMTGYINLKQAGKISAAKSVLTIADFDQSSTKKRLWIVDLDQQKLLMNTWVAHGQGSGADKPSKFSNVNNSYQSSVGFYVTGEIYSGQHGRSLRLDGMDQGFNSNARSRAIVVHGADYVSQGTISALGRLGRSQGCPAVAPELAGKVIDAIAGKTVLFINATTEAYNSKYLNEGSAAMFAANLMNHQETLDTVSSI